MTVTLDTSGLDKRLQQISTLKNLDARPLLVTWTNIIIEDNRRGVLAGLDKDGVPMANVTYRPKADNANEYALVGSGMRVTKLRTGNVATAGRKASQRTKELVKAINLRHKERFRETLAQFRRGQGPRKKIGSFGGIGANEAGINNNLSTAEYELLGGPPLAPRDQFSRVITNLIRSEPKVPAIGQPWEAVCVWDEVVDKKGRPFLHYHFEGIGQRRRDLRGVRPDGIAKALEALRNWARTIVHEHFGR